MRSSEHYRAEWLKLITAVKENITARLNALSADRIEYIVGKSMILKQVWHVSNLPRLKLTGILPVENAEFMFEFTEYIFGYVHIIPIDQISISNLFDFMDSLEIIEA